MVSRPTQPAQVNYTDWRLLKVDYVVVGTLTEDSPDRFTAVFQLMDVNRGEQVFGFRLNAGRADLRATGHRIADMIFEKLVGVPGRVRHADRVRERGEAARRQQALPA